MKRSVLAMAVVLIAAYLSLTVVTPVCALNHLGEGPAHHHPHSSKSHSSFCAWACQANQTSEGALQLRVFAPLHVWIPLDESDQSPPAGGSESHRASRGPPTRS